MYGFCLQVGHGGEVIFRNLHKEHIATLSAALKRKVFILWGYTMLLFFIGCFSPVLGEWGWFDVEISGDCSIDQSQTSDEWVQIEEDASVGFSLVREESTFSCSLDGIDFDCTSSQRSVESEEVTLTVSSVGSGSFTSSTKGSLRVEESWSCTAGECETYGLSACTNIREGSLGFSE